MTATAQLCVVRPCAPTHLAEGASVKIVHDIPSYSDILQIFLLCTAGAVTIARKRRPSKGMWMVVVLTFFVSAVANEIEWKAHPESGDLTTPTRCPMTKASAEERLSGQQFSNMSRKKCESRGCLALLASRLAFASRSIISIASASNAVALTD
jgi:hypothetical protein